MLRTLSAALAATFLALPAAAGGIAILDPYARASAQAGAVFLVVENHAGTDDRLVSVASDVAASVELHSHKEDANGVMQMLQVEGGIAVPAGGSAALARGGDHIMLMGLTRPLADGDSFTVTLTFESGAVVPVEVTVDNARMPEGHGGHAHGQGHGSP